MILTEPSGQLDWTNAVQTGGVVGLLLLVVFCLLTKRIVPGWTYEAMERDRDYYRELANKGTEIADRQMNLAEGLAERLDRADHEKRLRDEAAALYARSSIMRREKEDGDDRS